MDAGNEKLLVAQMDFVMRFEQKVGYEANDDSFH